jgi:transporter family protein
VEIWLLFAMGTILCYGTAQQFSKRGVQFIGSYQTGILYAIASIGIQFTYWFVFPDNVQGDLGGILLGFFAGFLGALGFVFYIFALKSGKVSIVSVLTAGYPAVSVLLAITLLAETLSPGEATGIILVVGAIILLSFPSASEKRVEGAPHKSKKWLIWAILSLIFWGLWAIPSKLAMKQIGESDYILIDGITMVLTWVPLWLIIDKGRMNREPRKLAYSGTAGILASVGTVSLFLGISNGGVALVTPLTSIYPILTVLLARFVLKEKLGWMQYVAIGAGVVGILLLAL